MRPGRVRDSLLLAAGVSFFAAQFYHTWIDRNRWPFCSYNMFNRNLPERIAQPVVRLHDRLGELPMAPVYGMLPLDFFRVVGIFAEVFLENQDEDIKHRFAERVVHRLNNHPWAGFDEVRPSYRPRAGGTFHGFDLYEAWIDIADFDPVRNGPFHEVRSLYRYRVEGCPR